MTTYFIDSWGGLWAVCPPSHPEAKAFGPAGCARPVECSTTELEQVRQEVLAAERGQGFDSEGEWVTVERKGGEHMNGYFVSETATGMRSQGYCDCSEFGVRTEGSVTTWTAPAVMVSGDYADDDARVVKAWAEKHDRIYYVECAGVAQQAHRMMRAARVGRIPRVYLCYRRGQLSYLRDDERPSDGWTLAFPEPLPQNLSERQLVAWVTERCRRVPFLLHEVAP